MIESKELSIEDFTGRVAHILEYSPSDISIGDIESWIMRKWDGDIIADNVLDAAHAYSNSLVPIVNGYPIAVTVGLINSIIAISNVLQGRDVASIDVFEAIKDLQSNRALRSLLDLKTGL